MITLGTELTWPGIRLSSLCGVPWTHAALIRVGYCGSLYKGNSCSHYSNSCVIIWYVRHLRTMHAKKTFILLICQYICALHLSFSFPLFFFFPLLFTSGRMHPNSQTIGSSTEIFLRQLLSYSTILNDYVYINIYVS